MTRDEAEFKMSAGTRSSCTEEFMTDFLDCALALGLLKVNETVADPERALIEKCRSEGFAYEAGRNLVDLIKRAGLKLSFDNRE